MTLYVKHNKNNIPVLLIYYYDFNCKHLTVNNAIKSQL